MVKLQQSSLNKEKGGGKMWEKNEKIVLLTRLIKEYQDFRDKILDEKIPPSEVKKIITQIEKVNKQAEEDPVTLARISVLRSVVAPVTAGRYSYQVSKPTRATQPPKTSETEPPVHPSEAITIIPPPPSASTFKKMTSAEDITQAIELCLEDNDE